MAKVLRCGGHYFGFVLSFNDRMAARHQVPVRFRKPNLSLPLLAGRKGFPAQARSMAALLPERGRPDPGLKAPS